MNQYQTLLQKMDQGGRRSGVDLRQFSYADHIPERRSIQDRRSGFDRRAGSERRSLRERRENRNEQGAFKANSNVIEMRGYKDRREEKRRALDETAT